jgi:hypothetical protein
MLLFGEWNRITASYNIGEDNVACGLFWWLFNLYEKVIYARKNLCYFLFWILWTWLFSTDQGFTLQCPTSFGG